MDASQLLLRAVSEFPGSLQRAILGDKKYWEDRDLPDLPHPKKGAKNLLIGPANSAGQGYLWAEAISGITNWDASNLTYLAKGAFEFQSHSSGLESAVVYSAAWTRSLRNLVRGEFKAVLNESLLPMFGSAFFRDPRREINYLREEGLLVGVICHGSDVRIPSVHRDLNRDSVFDVVPSSFRDSFEVAALRNNRYLDELQVPTFVSTPDLLTYRPDATWLPLQVWPQYTNWLENEGANAEIKSRKPVVLHFPSNQHMKGTAQISSAMQKLEQQNLIEYLQPGRVPHEKMLQVIRSVDIVIDAVGMGAYGVTSVEAMALGKPVVANLGPETRRIIREKTGLEVPIQEAAGNSIKDVIAELAADPQRRRELGLEGRGYVEAVHSKAAAQNAMADLLAGKK